MKAVFSVGGDGSSVVDRPNYDITICFNGVPGTVILEIEKRIAGTDPTCVMRSALKPSHARAIASALLSAATEVSKDNS